MHNLTVFCFAGVQSSSFYTADLTVVFSVILFPLLTTPIAMRTYVCHHILNYIQRSDEHDRHHITAASTMILNGVDMVSAAAELGHASPSTTANIYAHQFAIARAKAASVRAGVFANRK